MQTPYAGLSPDLVLEAIESRGYFCDGRQLALNSYENRVYQVGIENSAPLVAKFYRPGRWTDAQILEEHAFVRELAEQEIPAVPPLVDESGATLFEHGGYRFSLYRRQGGRQPELDCDEHLQWLGRFIGRIHRVGAVQRYQVRPRLDIESFGRASYQYVLENGFVARELEAAYRSVAEDALARVEACFDMVGPVRQIRLHGDCHVGNVLWTDQGPHFVDFDDSRMGPAVQDLWMLLSGDAAQRSQQLARVLEGYHQFADFDPLELGLIEALRTLRLMHYSAWIARRWQDPAFPVAFPWFDSPRYWEEQVLSLREQMAAMDEPALSY